MQVSLASLLFCLFEHPLTYLIANDEDEGGTAAEDAITVVDVQEAMRLQEIELKKAAFMGYIKGITY